MYVHVGFAIIKQLPTEFCHFEQSEELLYNALLGRFFGLLFSE